MGIPIQWKTAYMLKYAPKPQLRFHAVHLQDKTPIRIKLIDISFDTTEYWSVLYLLSLDLNDLFINAVLWTYESLYRINFRSALLLQCLNDEMRFFVVWHKGRTVTGVGNYRLQWMYLCSVWSHGHNIMDMLQEKCIYITIRNGPGDTWIKKMINNGDDSDNNDN